LGLVHSYAAAYQRAVKASEPETVRVIGRKLAPVLYEVLMSDQPDETWERLRKLGQKAVGASTVQRAGH